MSTVASAGLRPIDQSAHRPASAQPHGSGNGRWRAGGLVVGLLVAVLAIPAVARADTTLHVDQNAACSDTAPGTAEQPFCTIGGAAAKAGPGTTVVVAAGTYQERVKPPSGAEGSPVTFTAAPGATVVVTGGSYGFYLSGRSWVTIRGFTVTGTSYGIFVGGSSHVAVLANRVSRVPEIGINLTGSSDARVENNTVNYTGNYGIRVSPTALSPSSRNRVAGNAVSWSGTNSYRPAGISLYGRGTNTANSVVSNVSWENRDSGIEVYADDTVVADNVSFDNADHGIDVQASHARVLSNTITGNATSQVYVGAVPGAGAALVDNIADAGGGGTPIRVAPGATAGTSLDYDLVNAPLVNAPTGQTLLQWNGDAYSSLASFTAASGQEGHGIQADPRFVTSADPDPSGPKPGAFCDGGECGNFSLTQGSPALDSALSAALSDPIAPPTTDAFGGARVDDLGTLNTGAGPHSYADRGAYEFRNPGFETDTSGWNTSGSSSDTTLTRTPGGHTGAAAAALRNTGSSAGSCLLNDSPNWVHTTAAGTYTAFIWARADSPGANLKLRLREWSGPTALGEATKAVTLSTDWQPVRVQYTANSPGASTLDLSARVSDAPPGVCFYADDASITLR